jgi:outer membrane protein assembly factor BamA
VPVSPPRNPTSVSDLPPTIGQIAVEGNKFSKASVVLSKVKARKGDVVTDPAFRGDVDRLLESGLFEDVEVAVEDLPGGKDARGAAKVRVIFKIKERPLIRRVDFKGNRKLADSKFREGLVSKVDEPYDRFKASQDVSKILSVYHDEGLPGRSSRILYVPGPPHQQSDPDVFPHGRTSRHGQRGSGRRRQGAVCWGSAKNVKKHPAKKGV